MRPALFKESREDLETNGENIYFGINSWTHLLTSQETLFDARNVKILLENLENCWDLEIELGFSCRIHK